MKRSGTCSRQSVSLLRMPSSFYTIKGYVTQAKSKMLPCQVVIPLIKESVHFVGCQGVSVPCLCFGVFELQTFMCSLTCSFAGFSEDRAQQLRERQQREMREAQERLRAEWADEEVQSGMPLAMDHWPMAT